MDYKNLIETNFNIEINKFTLLDSHFGTDIFLAETNHKKFIVKRLPSYMTEVKNESAITDYLADKDIKVPILLKTNQNESVLHFEDFQFTVQSFVEGKTLKINTASKIFLNLSAELLGKINLSLKDYKNLPLRFDSDFFNSKSAIDKCKNYKDNFEKIKYRCDESTKSNWEKQIKHLERICTFNIDTTKLTYTNSHGDFNICQIVVNDENLTVVDWSSACKLPVCLEVITSYVFASPKCITGSIDVSELKEYITSYLKYFKLNDYDIKMMPHVLYFWHTMCNYHPNEAIADNYKSIVTLIMDLLNWLYENVEIMSAHLQS